MLSRNNVISTNNISPVKQQDFMKKLNKKKIKWIVKEVERRSIGVWTITHVQNITKQHAYRIAKKFQTCEPEFRSPGRKLKQITNEERNIVLQRYKEIRASPTMIEQYLYEKGIHISHNKIHRILLEVRLVKEEHRKKNRRKWVRFERDNSNSMWQFDGTEMDDEEWILPVEDDCSRYCVILRKFENMTTANVIAILEEAIDMYGKPKEILTDNGPEFGGTSKDSEFDKVCEK